MRELQPVRYDPFAADIARDPYPVYEWLRDEEPAYFAPETATFVFSRHDDVAWAIGDSDAFSSDAMHGVLLGQSMGVGEQRLPRSTASGALVTVDPPDHTDLRRIVNRGFTPRQIGTWRARIDEIVTDLLASTSGDRLDVVDAVASPLPVRVIAELIGAEAENAGQFKAWADTLTRLMNGSARDSEPDAEGGAAMLGLLTHINAAIDERVSTPRDDLITTLVQAEAAGELDRAEVVGFASLLLFAGTETTTNLIGNACWALLTHPDELSRVVDEPDRLVEVIEETLRWESPVQYVFRRATRPVERHGVEVPADSIVTLIIGSANRDPRHWGDNAAAFVPGRIGNTLAFGFGPHFCLGASLARAEAEISLAHLVPRLDGAEMVGAGDDMIDSMQFRGRHHLEVVSGPHC